jgi:hypothetical protein
MDGLQKEEVKTRYNSPGIGAEAEQTWFLEVFCYPPNVTKAKLVLSNQCRTVCTLTSAPIQNLRIRSLIF